MKRHWPIAALKRTRAVPWRESARAPALVLVLVTAVMAPGFSFTRVFFFRDLTSSFYPLSELAWAMLSRGQLPLWDPYSAFGAPLAAMADLLLCYPAAWLRFLLPYPFGFNLFIMIHFYLAALGAYGLARRLGMSRPAAFAAAGTFALSGPLLSLGNVLSVLVAGAWMPLAVLAVLWAAERPTPWRVMVSGAALGMQAIGGQPVFSFATAVLAMAFCDAPVRRFLRILAPAAIFGMALTAVQLLPTLELLLKSVRQSQFGFLTATYWSVHPLSLLEMVLPSPFQHGSAPLRELLYGAGEPYLVSLYLGLFPLGLATLAVLRSENRQVRWTALCAGVFTLLALGRHTAFYTVFYWLAPFVRQSRFPSKMMVATAFCLALLAGWGVDALRERRPAQFWWAKWALAVASGLALSARMADPASLAWTARQVAGLLAGAAGAAYAARLTTALALLAIVVWLSSRRARAAVSLAVLALSVDLAFTGYRVNPTAPAEIFSTRPPLVDLVGGGSSEFRVDGNVETTAARLPLRPGWSLDALMALETRLVLAYGAPLEGVRDARSLAVNKLVTPHLYNFRRRMEEWIRHRDHAALGRLNVRYFITTAGPPPSGVREVATVSSLTRRLAVWEIEGWRPRAEISEGRARILAEVPTRVVVETESATGGMLLLRDTYDEGWRARVDGVPVPIERAEEIFRAVRVPAGGHTVEFAYRPWTFPVGAAITAAALLLLAGAAIHY